MNELIVFTHNDLDALGSMLNIEYKFPDIPKKYFFTNYSNIPKIVQEIEDYTKDWENVHILIPDVSFSDNKDSLRKLYNLGKCTHIDHHLYPDGFWDEFPDMKVVWDKSKCATLLCNEYLGNTGKNVNLDKLSNIIDVYDLWQTEHPAFDFAQSLNDYFWQHGIEFLMNKIIQAGWKLPPDFKTVTDNIKNTYTTAIAGFEERKLIYRANDITVAFVNDWFNQILIPEMRKGQNYVVGANSHGIIRVRVNQNAPCTDEQLNSLRFNLTGTENIGHMHAFTYKIEGTVSMDSIIKEIEKVVKFIEDFKRL